MLFSNRKQIENDFNTYADKNKIPKNPFNVITFICNQFNLFSKKEQLIPINKGQAWKMLDSIYGFEGDSDSLYFAEKIIEKWTYEGYIREE